MATIDGATFKQGEVYHCTQVLFIITLQAHKSCISQCLPCSPDVKKKEKKSKERKARRQTILSVQHQIHSIRCCFMVDSKQLFKLKAFALPSTRKGQNRESHSVMGSVDTVSGNHLIFPAGPSCIPSGIDISVYIFIFFECIEFSTAQPAYRLADAPDSVFSTSTLMSGMEAPVPLRSVLRACGFLV